jgi:hypothetical protein
MATYALNESAFHFRTAEELWRASCSVAPQSSDQAEYLHDMAVDLLDIRELPTYDAASQRARLLAQAPPAPFEVVGGFTYDEDIPF